MHQKMLDLLIARCRQRVAEGDCPTIDAAPIEQLEDAIVQLADAALEPDAARGG